MDGFALPLWSGELEDEATAWTPARHPTDKTLGPPFPIALEEQIPYTEEFDLLAPKLTDSAFSFRFRGFCSAHGFTSRGDNLVSSDLPSRLLSCLALARAR